MPDDPVTRGDLEALRSVLKDEIATCDSQTLYLVIFQANP